MKTKVLIMAGILIIALAAVVAPVMAATSSGTTSITGNPPALMVLTITGSISGWSLDPLATQPLDKSSDVTMNVTSNNLVWVVNAKDALDGGTGKTAAGFMQEFDGTSAYSAQALGAAMKVGSLASTGVTHTEKTLSGTDQLIANGDGTVNALGVHAAIPLDFKQTVTLSDPVLTATNHVYKIVVTFTGSTV